MGQTEGKQSSSSDGATGAPSPADAHHEKQRKMLCAMHALNNALQLTADGADPTKLPFTQSELDQICVTLAGGKSFNNPHRTWWGLGNYDVNVLMTAAQSRGYDVQWHDARKELDGVDFGSLAALIVNRETGGKWYLLGAKGHHWLAIRRFAADGPFFNLDSQLKEPTPFADEGELKAYLAGQIEAGGHLLLLTKSKPEGGEKDDEGGGKEGDQ